MILWMLRMVNIILILESLDETISVQLAVELLRCE